MSLLVKYKVQILELQDRGEGNASLKVILGTSEEM